MHVLLSGTVKRTGRLLRLLPRELSRVGFSFTTIVVWLSMLPALKT